MELTSEAVEFLKGIFSTFDDDKVMDSVFFVVLLFFGRGLLLFQ